MQSHRRTIAVIWMIASLLVLMTWWHIVRQVAESEYRELTSAGRDLANLTRVSQEHADRTLHSADQVIRFVQARYLELGTRLDLVRLTEQGIIDAENFPQVGVIDARGIYILANRPISGRLDLSDREHFKVHVDSKGDQLYVSKPVLGRATGKWSIQLTRRISLPDGSFGGVVVVSIDPGYFSRFYSELRLGQQGVSTLVGSDGIVRARHPDVDQSQGADISTSPLFARLQAGERAGSYRSVSPIDKIERLLHFRRLARFPLVVVTGLSIDDVLANHHRNRDALVLQATMVTVLLLVLAASLTRYLTRVRRESLARNAAQDQVLERTEQINAILALSPDGFVGFDSASCVKYVNPAFIQMTGSEGQTFEGMGEAEFVAWLSRLCEDAAALPGILAQQPAQGLVRDKIVIRQGKRVLQVSSRVGQTHMVSRILYFRDVTHETEVDQIKSEFLSTAAHELRTPMASVYGFAEVLATQDLTQDEREEFVRIILEQSGNMTRILDELLDLARMEARRGVDFRLAPLDLQALAQEIVRSYRHPDGRAAPELVPTDAPMRVAADQGKLRQAILNVLSNAYKYSPSGGPVLLKFLERGDGPSRQLGLSVTDYGIGMTPEQLDRVFERFYRADKSGQLPGTGLGMSIVKEIIELHGGQIDIASLPGQRTTVTMWLPAEAARAQAAAGAQA